ncbi:MAG TPA: M20/M25/M40 family metallo-hydrolase [Candidatus Polarisedimenticolaceae bacterium]|nr:M20/M25/M40 family metallo-hydrolase [Candidatus Polarisedimenticolaceae bacterium]
MHTPPVRWTLLALCACSYAGSIRAADDPIAARIVEIAKEESRAYDKLAWLTDRIGHRLSGSAALDRAVEWAAAEFERDGLPRVWTDVVAVPHWVRGEESAQIVVPARHDLAILGLGGTIGTPDDGVTGEVVVVDGFEALETLGEGARGKIVLFDRAMERGFDTDNGYDALSKLRSRGASAAAKQGAIAMLIRSLGTADYRLPHTGALRYEDDVAPIPAAAVSGEDAMLISRLTRQGETVRVRLRLGARMLPDAVSANVLAELPGRERPEQIVVIGAHLDSWDVGTGAHDDGAGCAIVMETMRLLKQHDLIPKRTIRAVLFTNEENGLRGARDYAERYVDQMTNHVAAIESDLGGDAPIGFGVTAGAGGADIVGEIAAQLVSIGADRVIPRGGGADISLMKKFGVPQIGQLPDPTRYFDYHHTEADTLDKVARDKLDLNVAAMAVMAYMLAERDEPLPRIPQDERD